MPDNHRRNTYNNFNTREDYRSFRAAIHKIKNALSNNTNTDEIKEKGHEIKKWSNSVKWTDVASVLITAFLAYYTYRLFNVAVKQTEISEKNIALADSVFNLSKRQFDSSLASGKQSSDLQTKLIDAQIRSVNETQNQFQKQHKPYIKITNYMFRSLQIGKPIEINYEVKNIGTPVEVVMNTVGIIVDSLFPKSPYKKADRGNPNIILDAEGVKFPYTSKTVLTSSMYEKLVKKERYCYCYGEITYINHANDNKEIHRFIIRLYTLAKDWNEIKEMEEVNKTIYVGKTN